VVVIVLLSVLAAAPRRITRGGEPSGIADDQRNPV
jgi:hypothetical protein